jgi:hypothetical protein
MRNEFERRPLGEVCTIFKLAVVDWLKFVFLLINDFLHLLEQRVILSSFFSQSCEFLVRNSLPSFALFSFFDSLGTLLGSNHFILELFVHLFGQIVAEGNEVILVACKFYFIVDLVEILNDSILQEWVRIPFSQINVVVGKEFIDFAPPFEENRNVSVSAIFVVPLCHTVDVVIV